jgi:hypothetical protein
MYKVEAKMVVTTFTVDGQPVSTIEAFRRQISRQPVAQTDTVAVSGFFSGRNRDEAFSKAQAYIASDYFREKQVAAQSNFTIVEASIVKR